MFWGLPYLSTDEVSTLFVEDFMSIVGEGNLTIFSYPFNTWMHHGLGNYRFPQASKMGGNSPIAIQREYRIEEPEPAH